MSKVTSIIALLVLQYYGRKFIQMNRSRDENLEKDKWQLSNESSTNFYEKVICLFGGMAIPKNERQ